MLRADQIPASALQPTSEPWFKEPGQQTSKPQKQGFLKGMKGSMKNLVHKVKKDPSRQSKDASADASRGSGHLPPPLDDDDAGQPPHPQFSAPPPPPPPAASAQPAPPPPPYNIPQNAYQPPATTQQPPKPAAPVVPGDAYRPPAAAKPKEGAPPPPAAPATPPKDQPRRPAPERGQRGAERGVMSGDGRRRPPPERDAPSDEEPYHPRQCDRDRRRGRDYDDASDRDGDSDRDCFDSSRDRNYRGCRERECPPGRGRDRDCDRDRDRYAADRWDGSGPPPRPSHHRYDDDEEDFSDYSDDAYFSVPYRPCSAQGQRRHQREVRGLPKPPQRPSKLLPPSRSVDGGYQDADFLADMGRGRHPPDAPARPAGAPYGAALDQWYRQSSDTAAYAPKADQWYGQAAHPDPSYGAKADQWYQPPGDMPTYAPQQNTNTWAQPTPAYQPPANLNPEQVMAAAFQNQGATYSMPQQGHWNAEANQQQPQQQHQQQQQYPNNTGYPPQYTQPLVPQQFAQGASNSKQGAWAPDPMYGAASQAGYETYRMNPADQQMAQLFNNPDSWAAMSGRRRSLPTM